MMKLTIFNILEYPNGSLDWKKRFDKTVSEDLLRIPWKCMKIALII